MQSDLQHYLENYNKVTEKKLIRSHSGNSSGFSHPLYLNVTMDSIKNAGISNPFLESKLGFFWLDIDEPSTVPGESIFTNWVSLIAKKYHTASFNSEELRDAILDKILFSPVSPGCTIYNYDPFKSSFTTFLINIAKSCVVDSQKTRTSKLNASTTLSLDDTFNDNSFSGSEAISYSDVISDNIFLEDEFYSSPEFFSTILFNIDDTNESKRNIPLSLVESFIPKVKFSKLDIHPEYLSNFSYLTELDYVRLSNRVVCLLFLNNFSLSDFYDSCFSFGTSKIESDSINYEDFDTFLEHEGSLYNRYGCYVDYGEYEGWYINPSNRKLYSRMQDKAKKLLSDILLNTDTTF